MPFFYDVIFDIWFCIGCGSWAHLGFLMVGTLQQEYQRDVWSQFLIDIVNHVQISVLNEVVPLTGLIFIKTDAKEFKIEPLTMTSRLLVLFGRWNLIACLDQHRLFFYKFGLLTFKVLMTKACHTFYNFLVQFFSFTYNYSVAMVQTLEAQWWPPESGKAGIPWQSGLLGIVGVVQIDLNWAPDMLRMQSHLLSLNRTGERGFEWGHA